MTKVSNTKANLRKLLTELYVAVLAHIPLEGEAPDPTIPVSATAWENLCDTVLDAGEGREFEPLVLPWPPTDHNEGNS